MKIAKQLIVFFILGLFTFSNIPVVEAKLEQVVNNQISPSILPSKLVEQSKINYDIGRYSEALKFLEEAETIYKSNNNLLNQAQVLNWISLTYQQMGELSKAQIAIDKGLSLLVPSSNNNKANNKVKAQILNTQGRLQLVSGKAQLALQTWKEAQTFYEKSRDSVGVIGIQINQAEAMQSIGLYNRSKSLFADIKEDLDKQTDINIKVAGLHNLGNILRQTGNLQESYDSLLETLKLTSTQTSIKESNNNLNNNRKGSILLSLATTLKLQGNSQAATDYYQQIQQMSNISPQLKTQAQLNQLSLLRESELWQDADNFSRSITEPLSNLAPTRPAIFAQIKLAQNLVCIQQRNSTCSFKEDIELSSNPSQKSLSNPNWKREVALLTTAYQKAQDIQDKRSQSYSLGNLGRIYEISGQYRIGERYTQQALNISQEISAPDLSYQWFWQEGRLLKLQNRTKEATVAYLNAVGQLKDIRRDLVTLNPDIRFDFRDEIEPVYRQSVDLLLQPSDNQQVSQENLRKARSIIESLQLAELDNFFRAACIQPKVEIDNIVDQNNSTAAVVYPIVLKNQLQIILKLPRKDNLLHYTIPVTQTEVEGAIAQLRRSLIDVTATSQVKRQSQKLYEWLIQPTETELNNSDINTLVFVLDGDLRNIPMAVLYNRPERKYLMEKYNIALAPGLQLVEPANLEKVKLKALIAGLAEKRSVEGREFPSLPNLSNEVVKVKSAVSQSQELLNQKFTKVNLQQQIQSLPFSIIHLATHGQFSSDPDNTFLLTWDKLVKARELDDLLRINSSNTGSSNIELLVLSACKTAQGDKRAALGLAGVAVRAGAKSTLATLWTVDDESTSNLMGNFYQELNSGVSKAKALQNAQLKVFENEKRPYFWAPYILVGNWM